MQNNVDNLNIRLTIVLQRIEKLQGHSTYSDQVAKSFHLGMVGGSGKNTESLNRRKERDLDKTIKNAVILCSLYKERDSLQKRIQFVESGESQKKETLKLKTAQVRAKYWEQLKPGDLIDIGGNSKVTITKKNKKSIETGFGCKWTVNEIIGNEAAKLINL